MRSRWNWVSNTGLWTLGTKTFQVGGGAPERPPASGAYQPDLDLLRSSLHSHLHLSPSPQRTPLGSPHLNFQPRPWARPGRPRRAAPSKLLPLRLRNTHPALKEGSAGFASRASRLDAFAERVAPDWRPGLEVVGESPPRGTHRQPFPCSSLQPRGRLPGGVGRVLEATASPWAEAETEAQAGEVN